MDKENIKILELSRNAERIGWREFLVIGFVGDNDRSGEDARSATSGLPSSISGLRPPMYDEARSFLVQLLGSSNCPWGYA
jgi:hypothetical protein